MKLSIMLGLKQVKRLIILIVGVTLLLIGLALLILPGPGILVIILGLIILAVEFIWAKMLLKKAKQYAKEKIL
jgi:Flp pilus assembly protein TadB